MIVKSEEKPEEEKQQPKTISIIKKPFLQRQKISQTKMNDLKVQEKFK